MKLNFPCIYKMIHKTSSRTLKISDMDFLWSKFFVVLFGKLNAGLFKTQEYFLTETIL